MRAKAADYEYEFETPGAPPKAIGVRVYEGDGELPMVVLSAPEGIGQSVSQDVEFVAAEVLLREYPEEASKARGDRPWFLLVQHHPASYDLRSRPEERREVFEVVEFGDYRIALSNGGRVRDPEKALRQNTRSGYGVERLRFLGRPTTRARPKEWVELEAGEALDGRGTGARGRGKDAE